MIVTRPPGCPGELRLVTQPHHAHFAAELLALFRLPELQHHPRRRELLQAVREHDNGWRETDSAPRVDPESGAPYDFLSLPREDRLELWRRGCRRHVDRHPYVALLVTRHALELFSSRRAEPAYAELVAELEEALEELRDRCLVSERELAADYRWLELADALSLAVCSRWTEPFERLGWRVEPAGEELRMSPLPLAGATSFRVPCRYLPDRRYSGEGQLGAELAAARWQSFTVRVVG